MADTIMSLLEGEETQGRSNSIAKILVGSVIGTTIEYYDFVLFNICAGLVFPKLFFPSGDPTLALLQSYMTFGVAFVVRPFGAAIFGHLGDLVGRKSSLVATLSLMGLSSTAIGFIPSYQDIGIWSAVLLVTLRICQGIALGGEWGGAVLLAVEQAPASKRGLYGVFAQMGSPLGIFLVNVVMQTVLLSLSEPAFLHWGWRIAFWFSALFLFLGIYVRLNVVESAVFQNVKNENEVRVPIKEFFRDHWRTFLRVVLLQAPLNICSYGLITYYASYAQQIGYSASWILIGGMVGAFCGALVFVFAGILSDRIGRRRTYMLGCVALLLIAYPFYWLIGTRTLPGIIAANVLVWTTAWPCMFAIFSSLVSEQFPTRVRYTAISLSFSVGVSVFGGTAAFVAVWLTSITGTVFSVSTYIAAAAVFGILIAATMKDRYRETLEEIDIETA